ncbi:ligase-associated DNA damage response endonuclease PdeM [Lewinella sp. W8]|uniref:ligase-associated DNA damage response endonuclease PdeM n=1 Tax=Lewinella sp. W8 TaxID=2528208 RepID=UPI001068AC4B|nr:ligase-associated DNA damage response endonuclease PdeM [Lewinella sp. W8]MTB49599.1 ligase-associated DNA damage response endonuclease PdeM [Lewinella sp. W8]
MENVTVAAERLQLHPLRAAYRSGRRMLLLADLHLGKGAHFRKAGIAVPQRVRDENFANLNQLIEEFRPATVRFLGDLFHSDHNRVWADFCAFLSAHPEVAFELVPGNHDILPPAAYAEAGLRITETVVVEDGFAFSHHPLAPEDHPPGTYNLCGHLHPAVQLRDRGGLQLRLPAFYFGSRQGILPAFGAFTGCATVPVREGDQVFVLAEGEVVAVQ